MKRIVETTEADGLEKLIGETVQIWCMNYIYTGVLSGVNEVDVCLSNPSVVYETGTLSDHGFKDVQSFGVDEMFIRTSAIESYGKVNHAKS